MGDGTYGRGAVQVIGTIIAPMKVVNRVPVTASSYARLAQADRHIIGPVVSSANLATGGRIVTPKLSGANRRLLQAVIQNVTGAAAMTMAVDVWGLRPPLGALDASSAAVGVESDEYTPDLLLSLAYVQGAGIVNPSSKRLPLAAGMNAIKWCDVVTVTDYTRAGDAIKWNEATGGAITVDFDGGGYERLLFEVTPAANCGGNLLLGEL